MECRNRYGTDGFYLLNIYGTLNNICLLLVGLVQKYIVDMFGWKITMCFMSSFVIIDILLIFTFYINEKNKKKDS